MQEKPPLQSISDDELLRRLGELTRQSRRVEADLVAHIAEVDERRLYARAASPSMFAYCTDVLYLSGAEAYLRIAAARASRQHPLLLSLLADGSLHLTGIAMLARHLTPENTEGVLKRAVHRSKRQIEELITELAPQPDVPALMRKVPEPRGKTERPALASPGQEGLPVPFEPGAEVAIGLEPVEPAESPVIHPSLGPERLVSEPARPGVIHRLGLDGVGSLAASQETSPAPPATVLPLSPGRYKVQFTASAAFRDKLERLRALMRRSVPDGDLAAILEQAVTEKLERLEARRFATTKVPRKGLGATDTSPTSRRIPAAVRRAVTERDGNRCRYVDEQGRRCSERHRLEFHHRRPYGLGGDHDPRNIVLMCSVHNGYLAEQDYGRRAMARYRRSGRLPEVMPRLPHRSDNAPT